MENEMGIKDRKNSKETFCGARKKRTFLLACAFVCLTVILNTVYIPVTAVDDSVSVFVAVNGDDTAKGTIENPLATMDGARRKVAELKKSNPGKSINVYFRGGVYRIDETVLFTEEDSGSEGAPVTYTSYNGENVEFTSAHKLDETKFKKLDDEEKLSRLTEEGRANVAVLDLKAQGIPQLEKLLMLDKYSDAIKDERVNWILWYNDMEQDMAGWPNMRQYDTIKQTTGYNDTNPISFLCNSERQHLWTNIDNSFVEGCTRHTWTWNRLSYTLDKDTKFITTLTRADYGVAVGGYYRVVHLFEELDTPGEYYVDVNEMKLYYYPLRTLKSADIEFSYLKDPAVRLFGAKYINFSDIKFEKFVGTAIQLRESENINITECEFNNIGWWAVDGAFGDDLFNAEGSYSWNENICVARCICTNLGGGGIGLHGKDDNIKEITNSGNVIKENYIYNLGRHCNAYTGGIHAFGVGTAVENNVIHKGPAMAIQYSHNDVSIKGNEMYDMVREMLDLGTVYNGKDLVRRGWELSYNYVHDIESWQTGTNIIGLYEDDQLSGVTVHDNLIVNTVQGMLFGGGRDNVIYDNVMKDCYLPFVYDNRGQGWQAAQNEPGGAVYENIVKYPYDSEIYKEKYPDLANLFTDGKFGMPSNVTYKRNYYYNNENAPSIAGSMRENAKEYEDGIIVEKDTSEYDAMVQKEEEILSNVAVGNIAYEKNIELGDFNLVYPRNGQGGLDNTSQLFMWEESPNAHKYILRIYNDPEMTDCITEKETIYNYAYIEGLKTQESRFYWNVEAVSEAYAVSGRKVSKGAPYMFTTSKYDVIDKTEYDEYIGYAENVYDGMTEGTESGQYAEGTKSALKALIDKAYEITEREYVYQTDIDSVTEEIKSFLDNLGKYTNYTVTDIGYMLDGTDGWENASVKYENGELVLPAGNPTVATYTDSYAPNDSVMVFKMKVPTFGTWLPFSIKQSLPGKYLYNSGGGTGYLITVKSSVIELQHFPKTGVMQEISNNYVKEGEWHEWGVGAINCGNAVRLIVMVDGAVIFDYFDYKHVASEDGYFSILSQSADQSFYLMPTDESYDAYEAMPYSQSGQTAEAYAEISADKWSGDANKNGDEVTVSGKAVYSEKISANKIIDVDVTGADFDIFFALKDIDGELTTDTKGYSLKIEDETVTLVRYKNGTYENLYIGDNKCFEAGKTNNLKIKTKTSDGKLNIEVLVNGERLVKVTDDYGIFGGGYFGVSCDAANEVKIK